MAPDCQALVLGSFPGAVSLAAGDYYANPRNQFWSIASLALDQDLTSKPFELRYRALQSIGLGLWDVIENCEREGSLDQAIKAEQPVSFAGLRTLAPNLRTLLLNGRKAQQGARRVLSAAGLSGYRLIDLPSTSPAHAAMSRDEKAAEWLAALHLALPDYFPACNEKS